MAEIEGGGMDKEPLVACPHCEMGWLHSSGDGWDEDDECRCCNPDGRNSTGLTTPKRLAEFDAAEAAEAVRIDAMIDGMCKHCGGSKDVRNPAGNCDHLYWPDYLTDEAKRANGILPAPPEAQP